MSHVGKWGDRIDSRSQFNSFWLCIIESKEFSSLQQDFLPIPPTNSNLMLLQNISVLQKEVTGEEVTEKTVPCRISACRIPPTSYPSSAVLELICG